jgi:hypothetical protein
MNNNKFKRLSKLGNNLIRGNYILYKIEYSDLYNEYKNNEEFIKLNKYVMDNLHFKSIKVFKNKINYQNYTTNKNL